MSAINAGTATGLEEAMARLTSREHDVLALVARGHSNAGVAAVLGTTRRTVESHTSRIFVKLDLAATGDTHRRVLAALAYLRVTAAA